MVPSYERIRIFCLTMKSLFIKTETVKKLFFEQQTNKETEWNNKHYHPFFTNKKYTKFIFLATHANNIAFFKTRPLTAPALMSGSSDKTDGRTD